MTTPISNNINISEVSERVDKSTSQAPSNDADAAAQATATDQVTLTSDARRLGKVLEAAEAEPQVDATKVASLRESIESGGFKIDSGQIADRLLEIDRAFQS